MSKSTNNWVSLAIIGVILAGMVAFGGILYQGSQGIKRSEQANYELQQTLNNSSSVYAEACQRHPEAC